MPMSIKTAVSRVSTKTISMITMIGVKSKVDRKKARGKIRRTREKTGSVALLKNLTMGLYGSGLTQLTMADPAMMKVYILAKRLKTLAIAMSKVPSSGI